MVVLIARTTAMTSSVFSVVLRRLPPARTTELRELRFGELLDRRPVLGEKALRCRGGAVGGFRFGAIAEFLRTDAEQILNRAVPDSRAIGQLHLLQLVAGGRRLAQAREHDGRV